MNLYADVKLNSDNKVALVRPVDYANRYLHAVNCGKRKYWTVKCAMVEQLSFNKYPESSSAFVKNSS